MGFEGLPWSPWVILGHMDMYTNTFTQDGFWGTAPVPFRHIGTYGHALEYLHPRWVLRDCPGPLVSYWDIWTCIRIPSPRMGFEGLPRSPSVILGHMDMYSSTFTQDGFWGTALVPFGHIGTYGPALEYLHPWWVLRDCPGPLRSYWDIWTFTRVPSPRMGFEGLPRSPSVILGHMDMYSSTLTQDGFWGIAPVPFGHNGTYGHALEYLHPGWVLRASTGPLWLYYDIRTYDRW